MINIGILGSTGRVGSLLIDDLSKDNEAKVSACYVQNKLDKTVPEGTVITNDMKTLCESSDIIIDFSKPEATEDLLTQIVENGLRKPLVIATTGFSKHQQNLLLEASKLVPVLYASNMSLGVAVLNKLVALASKSLGDFDIEVVEQHHRYKVDSPSGTALTLAHSAANARGLDLD